MIVFKINNDKLPLISFSASALIHIILFMFFAFIFQYNFDDRDSVPAYVRMFTREINFEENINKNPDKTEVNQEAETPEKEKIIPPENEKQFYYDLFAVDADTSDLRQIYKENTLNVSIKYPAGWTYIDQNIDKKLDGITFWSVRSIYNPPPYIHIEVKEKYLFNADRYKHSKRMNNYVAYYNDPEELAGQVSQTVYLRTDTDEDFSIKLIMKGEDAFRSFQPVFFSMLRTFKFRDSFF